MSDDLKNILSGMFKTQGKLSKGLNQYTIEQIWRSTFGDLISSYTTRVHFSKGVLTVYITSSSLKEELSMTKDKVVERLNQNLKYNKVEKLIVR